MEKNFNHISLHVRFGRDNRERQVHFCWGVLRSRDIYILPFTRQRPRSVWFGDVFVCVCVDLPNPIGRNCD